MTAIQFPKISRNHGKQKFCVFERNWKKPRPLRLLRVKKVNIHIYRVTNGIVFLL